MVILKPIAPLLLNYLFVQFSNSFGSFVQASRNDRHGKIFTKSANSGMIIRMSGHQKKYFLAGLSAAAIAAILWFHPHQEILAVPRASAQLLDSEILDSLFTAMGYLIVLANFICWVAFAFLSYLLDPHFIFDLGGGNEFLAILQSIWQLSRDIMNVLFAVMLVFAAIYVIVQPDKKEFIQSNLTKFILSVIFVNFSWFFPRVLLDISSVLTSTVYGIPSLLSSECETSDGEECEAVVSALFLPHPDTIDSIDGQDGWDCGDYLCLQTKPLNQSAVSRSSVVLNGLVVNHARLLDLATTPPPDISDRDTTPERKMKFALQQGVLLIIVIALAFPLIAMCVAFFIRIPVLWITIAFMPFVFLEFAGGDKISGITQGIGKQIFDKFIKAAFLPAMVAVPLAVGYILINAGSQMALTELGGIPFRLLEEVGTLKDLLWLFIALGVMWVGVFHVLKQDTLLGKGAEKIEGVGKELGKLAVNLPLAMPIIPGPSGSGLKFSPAALFNRLSPSTINAQIRSGQDVPSIAAGIATGGQQPGAGGITPQSASATVNKIQINPTKNNEFKISLNALASATDTEKRNQESDKIIRILEQNGMTGVTRSNLEQALEEIRKSSTTKEETKNELEKAIANLKKTLPAPSTPAPATPTGGTAPAGGGRTTT